MNHFKDREIPVNGKETSGNRKKVGLFILLAVLLVLFFSTGTFLNSERIVEIIGTGNGYIIAFIVAFFAGFSALTAISFYSVLIMLISGGLDPFLLGTVTGVSLSIGDIFLFYFGRKGRDLISGKLDRQINGMARFFNRRNRQKYLPFLSYIYIGYIPLPNDWLLLFLASIRYPYRYINLIIIAGDLTHALLLSLLLSKGLIIIK
ncbi:MAG: hypothetical protein K9J30_10590 [Bacteroidales bacterium]|nr:hypothetical protein [Bacteroidales bacterium]